MSMQAEWATGNQRNTLTVRSELVFGLASFPGLTRKTKKPPKTAWAGNQVLTC